MGNYAFGPVNFVFLIGTRPSPGGSRSPLARTVSHLTLEVLVALGNPFLLINEIFRTSVKFLQSSIGIFNARNCAPSEHCG